MARILLVDDKPNILKVMGAVLRREGYTVEVASDASSALRMALEKKPDIIITDVQMPGMNGVDLFHGLRTRGLDIPLIFITAYASIPEAVSVIREGAVDYLTKPVDYKVLKTLVRKLLSSAAERRRFELSEERYLIGSTPVMQTLYERIEAVASTAATVLIRGENGTGKELVARAIHRKSRFREGPFIPVNCAAFNVNLLESELFGYEAGAFTGAHRRKIGFFETACGGTLFLDEVSELSVDLQVKLLRVLQERAFTRVGGTDLVKAEFRLIAATNKDLEQEVREGRFRQDLFYRLAVVPLWVPPLRDRLSDLSLLVSHFVDRICQREGLDKPEITQPFIDCLKTHTWPGNVRELENLIERILVLYRPKILVRELLQTELPQVFGKNAGSCLDERTTILTTLKRCRGNKTEVSRLLHMPRRTLYYKLKRYGISESEYSS
ncbi:MAG: sigma-54 dependent transcriptional regulator [Spirochaetes bacterium]|nr:sigma-54 dependent transcriptional regulator [Spirochaetota bacterium]